MKVPDFQKCITNFLTVYLSGHRGMSLNTIISYRDTFIIFLRYCNEVKGICPEKLTFNKLNRSFIEDFLVWLENEKNCSISTRNQRLAALKSFFRYVQIEMPENILLCKNIIDISVKRQPKPLVSYLSHEGIVSLLVKPDMSKLNERRDMVLLAVLYDSAARVQELCDLKAGDVNLSETPTIMLTGKGRKNRIVPLCKPTVRILSTYMQENGMLDKKSENSFLFRNRSGKHLSRSGVTYILRKYADMARLEDNANIPAGITPHCFRHNKAMHLLQSGASLIYIRDFLGHESIETTQIYTKIDTETKKKSIGVCL